jgi:hypothetical protein
MLALGFGIGSRPLMVIGGGLLLRKWKVTSPLEDTSARIGLLVGSVLTRLLV